MFRGAVVVSFVCAHPDAPNTGCHDVLLPVLVLKGYWVFRGVQSGPSVTLVGRRRIGIVMLHLPILPLMLVC